ncbi:hypothetical protein C7450_101633 [Chelatococcus asaccharovorans]|uniref:Uncharacterized protein n=1 Tax=Chelatococcus asaccharovorans TaxID=28210 RepID=A0A2V3UIL0_9HYPH|nr:hypothetical protein C7450_101633 [Chelatococcus asaccharovorans]
MDIDTEMVLDLDALMGDMEACLQSPECTDNGPTETQT